MTLRLTLLTSLALVLTTACGDKDGDDTGSSGGSESADADGDGFGADEDCDDTNADINPDAAETCDGFDNDCNGEIDEGVTSMFYADSDGDGYAGDSLTIEACEAPEGFSDTADDCDDLNADANPGGTEVCDGADNNCDGEVDEGMLLDFYDDADTDGYGDASGTATQACAAPSGMVDDNSDCDDDAFDVNPGAIEVCDDLDLDEDCSGDADDADVNVDIASMNTWYPDIDTDGYGDADDAGTQSCDDTSGAVTDNTDCNDDDITINPGASEVCDADDTDEDCSGAADDADSGVTDPIDWYLDYDGDSYGGTSVWTSACEQPAGYTEDGDDCDDLDATINPGADEVCDDANVDEDCSGDADDSDAGVDTATFTDWYDDGDGDGYGDEDGTPTTQCDAPSGAVAGGTDCDDSDSGVNPDAEPVCGEADTNCNGQADWEDGDGDGVPECEDCDDADSTIFPYAWEDMSDGIDNDCDGDADALDTSLVTTVFTTGDDSSTTYTPTDPNWSFPFCGTTWTEFAVQTNGQIMFGFSHSDFSESTSEFNSDGPTIAPYWDDYYATGSGTVYAVEHDDAIGIYFEDISDCCSSSGGNTLAAVMRNDGMIQITIEEVNDQDGIVGWSCASDSGALESDLSVDITDQIPGTTGIGMGTEEAHYEDFAYSSSQGDIEGATFRMCGNAGDDQDEDGWSTTCGDPNDGNYDVYPGWLGGGGCDSGDTGCSDSGDSGASMSR